MTCASCNGSHALTSSSPMRAVGYADRSSMAMARGGSLPSPIGRESGSVSRKPEDILGRYLPGEMSATVRNRARRLAPFYSDGDVTLRNPDYTDLGPIGQLEACLQSMYAEGARDTAVYTAVLAAGVYTATVLSIFKAVGVCIDWSLGLDSGSMFQMAIAVADFDNEDGGNVGRLFTLKIGAPCAGGKIIIPFAYRDTGMGDGRQQIGHSVAAAGVGTGTVAISGVPAGLTSFGFSVELLTAFDPITAEYATMAGVVVE